MHDDIDLHLIGGCGSSGTTLLAHLLHRTHDIHSGPEMAAFHHRALYDQEHFQRNLYRCLAGHGLRVGLQVGNLDFPLVPNVFFMERDYYGVPGVDGEHELLRAADDLPTLLRWMKAQMAANHGIHEDFLWLDQTPKNAVSALEFLQSVPGGKFIHLLRDGRDVVASLARRYAQEEPGHGPATYLLAGCARWCFDTRQAHRARNEAGYLEVRYEDLVQDPVHWVNQILAHLGRPPVSDIDTHTRHTPQESSALLNGAKPTWTAAPNQPVTDKAVGRWREQIDPRMMGKLEEFRFQLEGEDTEYHFGHQLEAVNYA